MEDKLRRTGRTTRALLNLFAECLLTNRNGGYIVHSISMKPICMSLLTTLVNSNQIVTTKRDSLTLRNGKQLFIDTTSSNLSNLFGIENPIIVYDHVCIEMILKYKESLIKHRSHMLEV